MTTSDAQPQRRERGTSVALFARVRPEFHAKARRAAAVTGVSLATYIEQLVARDEVDQHGRPVWWPTSPPAEQEELPLSRSA